MNFFYTDKEVLEIELNLSDHTPYEKLEKQLELAWALRQRDKNRVQTLIQDMTTQLNHLVTNSSGLNSADTLPLKTIYSFQLRLTLIRAEIEWLSIRIDEAQRLVLLTLKEFTHLEDWLGCADAHWLLAHISIDKGKFADSEHHLLNMIEFARKMDEQVRIDVAQATNIRWKIIQDPTLINEQSISYLNNITQHENAISAVWANDALAFYHYNKSNIGVAVNHWVKCYEKGLESGQLYFAIVAATNAANTLLLNNESNSALDWFQPAIELARQLGYPKSIARCLIYMAVALESVKNFAQAEKMLEEALILLTPLKKSTVYASAQLLLGNLAFSLQKYDEALLAYQECEAISNEINANEFQIEGLHGQAKALNYCGNPLEALAIAERGLELAKQKNKTIYQIELITNIVEIYQRHQELIHIEKNDLVINYLNTAIAIAKTVPKYIIKSNLYVLFFNEYQLQEEYELAYETGLKALKAKENEQDQDAFVRIDLDNLFHQINQARKESNLLKNHILLEKKRAEEIQKTSVTLENLGDIGREIILHLDQKTIFNVIQKYTETLLEVNIFNIFLYEETTHSLAWRFSTDKIFDDDQNVQFAIDNPQFATCRCFREQKEIVINQLSNDLALPFSDAQQSYSRLYFPISVGELKLGVLSIESIKSNGFDKNELLVLRNITAFAAIGLQNANIYKQLIHSRNQVVQHEKLEELGLIIANFTKEIKEIISASFQLAQLLADQATDIQNKYVDNAIRRNDLLNHLQLFNESNPQIIHYLESAAKIVAKFKLIAD